MLSAQRPGGPVSAARVVSQTQDLWLEAAYEQEFAERHAARLKAAANPGMPPAPAPQMQPEGAAPLTPVAPPTPAQQHAVPPKATTVMAMPVFPSGSYVPAPQMQVTLSVGKPMSAMTAAERKVELQRLARERAQVDLERKLESERISRVRQQRINWYRRPKAETMAPEERKAARERLYKTPAHIQQRDKSPTGLGHVLASGETSPHFERAGRKYLMRQPKSRGGPPQSSHRSSQSSHRVGQQSHRGGGQPAHRGASPSRRPKTAPAAAGGGGDGEEKKQPFEGLTMQDYLKTDWRPSFTYRPAKQEHAWENLEGFSKSTRSLERRKMDPFMDIQSYNGAGRATGYVRPLDVKGQLGARAVQQWKNSLREDFAQDNDNFSSNAHDASMDALRSALGAGTMFAKAKSEIQ